MSEPFLGEIRMVGFTFAPQGWALCNGQIMSISQNTALFPFSEQRTVATVKRLSACRTCEAGYLYKRDKVRD